jgi:hypothetical protein
MRTPWLVGLSLALTLSLGLTPLGEAQRGPAGGQGLAAQLEALQAQLTNLQAQVDALAAAVAPDDGTAAALVGTWTGPARSMEFVGAFPGAEPFFRVQNPGGTTFQPSFSVLQSFEGPIASIGVNPAYRVARPSEDPGLALTLLRDGTTLSGLASQGGADVARLRGLVLGNNFFLLRACAMFPAGPSGGPEPCPPSGSTSGPVVIYQAVGTLNRDRTRILLTGTALEADGHHSIFNLGLTR